MIEYVGNERNVYILESNKLYDHVKSVDMMNVHSSPTCEDMWLNTEYKTSNW